MIPEEVTLKLLDVEWSERGRVITVGPTRLEVLSLGCGRRCVTLLSYESLVPALRAEMEICGRRVDLRKEFKARILVLHGPCDIKFLSKVLRIPDEIRELPSFVRLSKPPKELQEFGRNLRGSVIHLGDPRVYVLLPQVGTTLLWGDVVIPLPSVPILLAAPEGSSVRLNDAILRLP
ncbi:MAG: hypothetical protein QXO55_06175 [Candidatus Korarchaeum sp.]